MAGFSDYKKDCRKWLCGSPESLRMILGLYAGLTSVSTSVGSVVEISGVSVWVCVK